VDNLWKFIAHLFLSNSQLEELYKCSIVFAQVYSVVSSSAKTNALNMTNTLWNIFIKFI